MKLSELGHRLAGKMPVVLATGTEWMSCLFSVLSMLSLVS